MARLDTPLPAHHVACAVAAEILPCPYIAAVLDGDATATVRKIGPGLPRPRLIVAARDDDPTPFSLAATIARYRGDSIGWLRHRPDLRRNEWVVDDPAELVAIVAWLHAAAEPLAPRLSAQLEVLEQAAVVIRDSPGCLDILSDLAHVSSRIARSAEPLPPTGALLSASEERIWWEVAGLLASDGHFAVRDRHARFAPVASVSQRMDNAALLEALQDRTGLGDLSRQGNQLTWRVTRAAETAQIADRLRSHALPLVSPRRPQFEIWAVAVALKADGRRNHVGLAASADALRSARRYVGPRLLCTCADSEPVNESSRSE